MAVINTPYGPIDSSAVHGIPNDALPIMIQEALSNYRDLGGPGSSQEAFRRTNTVWENAVRGNAMGPGPLGVIAAADPDGRINVDRYLERLRSRQGYSTHMMMGLAGAGVGLAALGGAFAGGAGASGAGGSSLAPVSVNATPMTMTAGQQAALANLGYSVAPASAGLASLPTGIGAAAGAAGAGGAGAAAGAGAGSGAVGAAANTASNAAGDIAGGAASSLFPRITEFFDNLPDWLGDVIGGAGAIIGADRQSGAAQDAVNAQLQGQREALDFLRESRDMAIGMQQPFLQSSNVALGRLMNMMNLPAPQGLTDALGEAGVGELPAFDITQDPSYQTRLNQGMSALENSAAARGSLNSGGFTKAALQFAQDYASNEYQNIYNRLANLAGYGTVASQVGANAITNYGNNAAGIMQNMGNARASGYTARGNIWGNAINQLAGIDWSTLFGDQ